MARLLLTLLVLGTGLALAGCKSNPAQPGATDDGVTAVQFQDIVVPSGMKLQDNRHESHSIEATGWRMGHFVYEGMPKIEEACSHILQRMPQHAWKLVADEQPDPTTRKLRFSRGRYEAAYTLRRQDGVTFLEIDYKTGAQ